MPRCALPPSSPWRIAWESHKSTVLTLSVLNGNPAQRLYERFGFVVMPEDECEQCCAAAITLCAVGRPYGCCHPHCGASDMRKVLS